MILKRNHFRLKENMPPKRYQKKDPISHCLDRPDMYVGSTRIRKTLEFVAEKDGETYKILQKEIESCPAILRIFIEALSNATDNVERSRGTKTPCTSIKVSIDKETGETSIWNDGDIVPIEIHDEEKCYNHTLIFGQLLTGSNYDDEEERIVAGRNGLGIKLCNIFSTKFTVKGYDPEQKKKLTQTWTNNMRNTKDPLIIKSLSKNIGFTEVSWIPDFKHFGLQCYTKDIINLYTRYIIDAAMLSKVNVYLNDILIPVKTLGQYAELYNTHTEEKLLIKTKTCEVLLVPSTNFQAISFVNGVFTKLGGQHVDAWSEAFFRPIVDKFNGKDKKVKTKTPKININDVKQFFRLFVVSTIVRPEFDGQDKNRLESPSVNTEIKSSQINAIMKWSVIVQIEDIIKAKEMIALKKVTTKQRHVKVDGLDPANNSGGKLSNECSLFICEGLSAKTYVVAGIDEGVYGKKGRDWFGILPVTGKILNVRNSTPTNIASNKVIVSFIQSLGLQYGVDYTKESNYKSLYYGKIICITDADCDGIHIEGLLVNLIHNLFPSLLEREIPFVVSMKTPIARVSRPRNKDVLFYDERRFIEFIKNQTQKYTAKYYKGLGTTRAEDVPDTFGKKMVEYINDEYVCENMNKIFHKNHADERKEWLSNYNPDISEFSLDDKGDTTKMDLSDFLNGEMIKFSHADCARSLPHGIDGLKESQRKILYAVRKRNLKYSGTSLKVAQLSGYTAEHSNYHHGEQNLQDTIVGMATGYPGTNNIPLLYPDGGFGTRLEGGKDAASARYIFTKMEGLTEYIFRIEDEPLLISVNDDGDLVQPEYYVPIIPMILVNGCFHGNTQIILWNGKIKLAQDIQIGDILIGDDGTPRNVLNLYSGQDQMYEICQNKAENYIVNSKHILTLILSGSKTIFWSESRQAWKMDWYDNGIKSKFISAKSKDEAYNSMLQFSKTITPNNIVEITVENYLKLPNYIQKRMKGYKSEAVVMWEYQEVSLDPYILGAWLGDGDAHGRGFSNIDHEVISAFEKWADKNEAKLTKTDKYHYYIKRDEKTLIKGTRRTNPLKEALKKYNLIENKHIPNQYIYNDEKTRLSILAGLIDTDGHVYSNGEQIIIAQSVKHKLIIDSIITLARSLGFCCHLHTSINTIVRDNVKYFYDELVVNISGKNIHKIPTRIERKKCKPRRAEQRNCMLTQISINKLSLDKYYGWKVDNNERFVLADYTVTHNCTAGIGTGWSCNLPCYNPIDLVNAIRTWLSNEGEIFLEDPDNEGETVSMLPDITPWYRGFKGEIKSDGKNRFITHGVIETGKRDIKEVTELPVGMWTNRFKEFCEDLVSDKKVKSVKNYSTTKDVNFVLHESRDALLCTLQNLKLHTYLYTSNMVLFNEKNQLKKYDTIDEIIDNFCKVRLDYYAKRKVYQISALEKDLCFLGNKQRFVQEIIDEEITILNENESAITTTLKDRGYDEEPNKGGYDYLLRMQIRTFTADKVKQLKNDIMSDKKKLSELKATSEEKMWLGELKEFEDHYNKWLVEMEKRVCKKKK